MQKRWPVAIIEGSCLHGLKLWVASFPLRPAAPFPLSQRGSSTLRSRRHVTSERPSTDDRIWKVLRRTADLVVPREGIEPYSPALPKRCAAIVTNRA